MERGRGGGAPRRLQLEPPVSLPGLDSARVAVMRERGGGMWPVPTTVSPFGETRSAVRTLQHQLMGNEPFFKCTAGRHCPAETPAGRLRSHPGACKRAWRKKPVDFLHSRRSRRAFPRAARAGCCFQSLWRSPSRRRLAAPLRQLQPREKERPAELVWGIVLSPPPLALRVSPPLLPGCIAFARGLFTRYRLVS